MYHLCACLIRNLFDEQEKNDNDEMYSTIFGSEEINDKTKSLALEVVKHQTHIVDQLLVRQLFQNYLINLHDIVWLLFYPDRCR